MNLKMKVTSVFTAFLMMFSSCLPVAAQEKQTKFVSTTLYW